jgi:hypothetical protein
MFRVVASNVVASARAISRSPSSVRSAGGGLTRLPVQAYSSAALLSDVFDKIACIGTGKMAQAVIEPMIKKGVQSAENFSVFDVSPKTMEQVHQKLGVKTADSIPELVSGADLVICAVKPQNLTPAFFQELRKSDIRQNAILLSVIAGKSSSVFTQGGFEKVVRSMPNTPATIGEGMTVWSCTPNLTVDERKKIRQVLSSCGKSVRITTEEIAMEWTPSVAQPIIDADSLRYIGQPSLTLSILFFILLNTFPYRHFNFHNRCTSTTNPSLTWRLVFRDLVQPTFSC